MRRIFIEPSGYAGTNLGDRAMFEVAVQRLALLWPGAQLIANAFDLDPIGSKLWSAFGFAATPLPAVRRYLAAVRGADLLVVTGAGHLNDAFRRHALRVLDTLELAMDAGAVTALVGQGIGPMTDARLRARTARLLPRVDFITLREGLAGPPLLASLGVPPERIRVTGDDAIAVAYRARSETAGEALGVNLRVARYANVTEDVAGAVEALVRARGVPLLAVPTAAEDLRLARLEGPFTLENVLRALSRCRVLVTGSYHGALFALSMGIPAVTFARSDYYADKFRGLAAQFGPACRVVFRLDELSAAIDDAWQTADAVRDGLLERARAQIALSEAAYAELGALAAQKRRRSAE